MRKLITLLFIFCVNFAFSQNYVILLEDSVSIPENNISGILGTHIIFPCNKTYFDKTQESWSSTSLKLGKGLNIPFFSLIYVMIDNFKKLIEEEERIKEERTKLEKQFTTWLTSQKHWKIFICNLIAESGNYEKYKWTREYVIGHLKNDISNVKISGDKINFTVRIIEVNNGTMFPHSVYIETGFFDMEKLQTISEAKPDPEDVLTRIKRKEKRVKEYESEIEDIKKQIESEEKEIENLKSWIE